MTTGRENKNAVIKQPKRRNVAPLRLVSSRLLKNEPKKRMNPSFTPLIWRRMKSIATMIIVTSKSRERAEDWGRR